MNKNEIEKNKKAAEFYEKSWLFYRKMLHIDKTMAIHYGHYEKGIRTYDEAIINKNNFIGKLLDLDALAKSKVTILDSGCGFGGTSIYLAKKYPNIKFIGINSSIRQIFLANEFARQNGVSTNTDFIIGDYLSVSIIDNCLDGIFAIQSFAQAKDKRKFLMEAHRVLKPNGKLIIDDAFLIKKPSNYFIKRAYMVYCKLWNISYLEFLEDFKSSLQEIGFSEIKVLDVTKNVRLSFFINTLKWIAYSLYAGREKKVGKKKLDKMEEKTRINNHSTAGNRFSGSITIFLLSLLLILTRYHRVFAIAAVKRTSD